MTQVSSPSQRAGFTLIELLVVMSILALVATFTIPAVGTILKGNQVAVGSQMLVNNLTLARQTALANNRIVEVRFYQYTDPGIPGGNRAFRALQLFQYDEANQVAKPIGKFQRLPGTLVMDGSAIYSSLITDSSRQKIWGSANDPQVALPGAGVNYAAYYVRFRPDGSTDLTRSGAWFVTLHGDNDTSPAPAKNYATLQIDPVNGAVKTYRPG